MNHVLETPASTFITAVKEAAKFTGKDGRPILEMVAISATEGRGFAVATDSYKLLAADIGPAEHTEGAFPVVLFHKKDIRAVTDAASTSQTVRIEYQEGGNPSVNGVKFQSADIEPLKWRQLIPGEEPVTIAYDQPTLTSLVKSHKDLGHDLKLTFVSTDEATELIVQGTEVEFTDKHASWFETTEPVVICVAAQHLMPAVKVTGGALIECHGQLKPMVLRGDHRLALVMPIRLAEGSVLGALQADIERRRAV